ncbi:MAG: ribosome biogenesis GTP-binding protein YihA/YsxC [Gammaproteobacteria bacterium]
MSTHYQKAHFLISCAEMTQLPPDEGIEVAVVGRSNAGKSSVINRLTNIRGLARVSKTPGRTQLVNLFGLDDNRRLTDLPGYGFAKVPLAVKIQWQKTVDAYISERECLRGLVIIMDIRHPLRETDVQLLEFCDHRGLAVHIVLNKADKISKGAASKTLLEVKAALTGYRNSVTFQVFSALKGTGLQELHAVLDEWYGYKKSKEGANA